MFAPRITASVILCLAYFPTSRRQKICSCQFCGRLAEMLRARCPGLHSWRSSHKRAWRMCTATLTLRYPYASLSRP
jgi:hypothetical protein